MVRDDGDHIRVVLQPSDRLRRQRRGKAVDDVVVEVRRVSPGTPGDFPGIGALLQDDGDIPLLLSLLVRSGGD